MDWSSESYCLYRVKNNGYALRYVLTQTSKICMAAVTKMALL